MVLGAAPLCLDRLSPQGPGPGEPGYGTQEVARVVTLSVAIQSFWCNMVRGVLNIFTVFKTPPWKLSGSH